MRWTLDLQFCSSLFCCDFSPPLSNGDIRASPYRSRINLWVREALNNSVTAFVISFEVSFSVLAGIPSVAFALYTSKSSRNFFTLSVIVMSSVLEERGHWISGIF